VILSSGEQADQLVDLASVLNARVVAISSMDIYRARGVMLGTEPGALKPMPITEDSRLRTARRAYPPELVQRMKSIFTWVNAETTKSQSNERSCAAEREAQLSGCRMVYGPGNPLYRLHVILKRIRDGRPAIILPDDHAAWRGPRGYAENVAHAIAVASTSERALRQTYHVCDEPSLTEFDWQTRSQCRQSGARNLLCYPVGKHLSTCSCSEMRRSMCRKFRTDSPGAWLSRPFTIDESIQRTIAWEQANLPTGPNFHQFDYCGRCGTGRYIACILITERELVMAPSAASSILDD